MTGLSGPPCSERADLDQGNPPGLVVQKMCVRCGRVTARTDGELPWCGGARQMDASYNLPAHRRGLRAA